MYFYKVISPLKMYFYKVISPLVPLVVLCQGLWRYHPADMNTGTRRMTWPTLTEFVDSIR